MTTLSDVARLAGVSPATASRIITGSSKPVTDALRQRVLAAVAELQYVPNAHAQSLARSQRTAVGVIVHDVSDPYFAEITRGIQKVASENGRLATICNSYRNPARELEYVELLWGQQVAAIVLTGSGYHDDEFTAALDAKLAGYERGGGHVAVIGRHRRSGDTVSPGNELGGYLSAAELFALGHQCIGVVAGPSNLTTTTDRMDGMRRAAREYGRKIPDSAIAYADFERDTAMAAVSTLLDREPDITAIAALNDLMAIGILSLLRSRGISVPEEMSVMGFDDIPVANDVTPALTTIRLPLVEMGARAMTLALEPAPNGEARVEDFGAEIIRRDSTARPRAKR